LGKGLTINISKNGKRRVSWSSKVETKVEILSRENSRDKWVPKLNKMDHKGPVVENLLVGSKARPNFEIGGPSESPNIGPVLITHQPKHSNWVKPQIAMDNPRQLALALTRECVDGQAAIERRDTRRGEIAHHMGWFFQLTDGCRLVIPDFVPPLWSPAGISSPWGVPTGGEPI
jgi:hypothetical protein